MVNKIIGGIALVVGAFFAFAPHYIHVQVGFTFPHVYHVTFGIIMLVLSAYLLTKKPK